MSPSFRLKWPTVTRHTAFFLIAFVQFLLSRSVAFGQVTYYVSSAGDDANNGRTTTTPFQTLNKVSGLYLQAGDSVLFRRGDTFRGTLTIRRSGLTGRPIVFDTYGSGAKPVLAGSVPLTNWTNIGNNVWQASCASCGNTVTGVYRNESPLPLGRFPNGNAPNKGYMTIRAHTQKYQIVGQEHLPQGINWQGGEVVMRPTQWIIDRATIDRQFGDTLNIINNSNYEPGDGWGYFIQNHPATLDQEGEWYYDPANKTVRLFSSQASPVGQMITATVSSQGVDAAYLSNVALRNLHVTQTLNTGLNTYNVSSFSVVNSDITNSGEDGVSFTGSGSGIWLENNRIIDVNNNGFAIDVYQSVVLRGNTLRRIGMVPGRGKSGDGHYNGLLSNADQNVLIENNIIDSVGYNGLTFWNNTTIRQNVISNYCMTKSDGGGVYVWNHPQRPMMNVHLVSNIIYNGIGAKEGSFRAEYSGANGIFLDDCVEDVELKNNTVFNNHQWGVYLHATSRVSTTGNTVFDNRVSQFVMYHNGGYCPFRENIVKNNVFVSKLASQLTAQYESNADDLPLFGVIDSNYYARPFAPEASILGVKNYGQSGGVFSLPDWRNFSGGHDLHSQSSPVSYNQYKDEGAGGTNRFTSLFDTDDNGWVIIYSNYNNAAAVQDNSGKLDGGSLRVSFSKPSGKLDSYAQAVKRIGPITAGKTYVLRFDAVASTNVNILVYLRSAGPPYTEYDRRYTVAMSPNRTSYELPFTANEDGNDAVVMFQIDGEGPIFWLDNVRLQEDVPIRNEPDDFIKLFYNPTLRDSVITLSGVYRDAKNQLFTGSVTLKPFTSIVLLRTTLPAQPADLSLSLQSDKRALKLNELTTLRLRVSNQSETPASLARWTCRLPANLQFVPANGQAYDDNVLTGTVSQLAALTDTTFAFTVRPTVQGAFRTAAQITTAISPDPDSTPNSGVADGEDDAAVVELRVGDSGGPLFSSPNPNQIPLPPVVASQPKTDPSRADLSLRMVFSRQTSLVNDTITCALYVTNAGGLVANSVQIQDQLPTGFAFIPSPNWTATGSLLSTTLASVGVGATVGTSFRIRVTAAGTRINLAQISASDSGDPDSTPGNGFANGEDDEAQAVFRSY